MRLFPKLPIAVAREIASASATASIRDLAAASAVDHPAALYAAVGGARARPQEVEELRVGLRVAAGDAGYPLLGTTEAERVAFDAAAARI